MVANTGKENNSNNRKKILCPLGQRRCALCHVDCLAGTLSRPNGYFWSGRSKMVLIGLRHFKKDVQGTAFALLYTHRKRDTEI